MPVRKSRKRRSRCRYGRKKSLRKGCKSRPGPKRRSRRKSLRRSRRKSPRKVRRYNFAYKMEQANICSICRETPTDVVTTPCGHTFCKACLHRWIQQKCPDPNNITCPMCRTVLDIGWRNDNNLRCVIENEDNDIFFAVQHSQHETLAELLSNGINPNIEDDRGFTPLMIAAAAQGGHALRASHIIRILIQYGADPNKAVTFRRRTPLFVAAEENNAEAVRQLLMSGADPNKEDYRGFTPLHVAVSRGNSMVVMEMMRFRRDIDIDKISDDGATALILSVGARVRPHRGSLERVVGPAERLNIIEMLLDNGANPNRDTDVHTPLTAATKWQDKEVLLSLLRHGADPNKPVNNGSTPLHFAVDTRNITIIELLLGYNADPSNTNNDGETPCQIALRQLGSAAAEPARRRALVQNVIKIVNILSQHGGCSELSSGQRYHLSQLKALQTRRKNCGKFKKTKHPKCDDQTGCKWKTAIGCVNV